MNKFVLSAAGLAAAVMLTAPAQAATKIGVFGGNDCTGAGSMGKGKKGGGGGASFSSCFVSKSGINTSGENPSSVVFKFEANGKADASSNYGTIDGNEFDIDFISGDNILTFTYDPDADDPGIHYFAIKHGNEYALYYSETLIMNGSVDMDFVGFAAGTDSFSHITFFNSSVSGVPEPGTWAMLILGFGAVGGAMRSARKRRTTLAFG